MRINELMNKIHAAAVAKGNKELAMKQAITQAILHDVNIIHGFKEEMKSLVMVFKEMEKYGFHDSNEIIKQGWEGSGFIKFSNRVDITFGVGDKVTVSVLDDGDVCDVMYNGYDVVSMLPCTDSIEKVYKEVHSFVKKYQQFKEFYINYIESLEC